MELDLIPHVASLRKVTFTLTEEPPPVSLTMGKHELGIQMQSVVFTVVPANVTYGLYTGFISISVGATALPSAVDYELFTGAISLTVSSLSLEITVPINPERVGGRKSNLEWLEYSDLGINYEVIDARNALLCIFEPIPRKATLDSDNEFPDWLIKYVEYATLERAFGADTDGFIPSLRDYWKYRKDIGLQAIKRYRVQRLKDRSFVLQPTPRRNQKPTPKLPYGYNDPY